MLLRVRVRVRLRQLNGGPGDKIQVRGGETTFPHLNVTVEPRRGRVAMWPNVFPNTTTVDQRLEHVAMPVLAGLKYGTYDARHDKELCSLDARASVAYGIGNGARDRSQQVDPRE